MVSDKSVERILTVGEIFIILTCILRIYCIVNLLGISFQFINIMNVIHIKNRVWLNKCRIFEIPLLSKMCVLPIASVESIYTLCYGVSSTAVSVVDIICERIVHVSNLKSLTENCGFLIGFDKMRQKEITRL